jgi:hypothetical protein
MLVLGVLTPLFVLVYGAIETVSAFAYTRDVNELSARPPIKAGGLPRCRICGAPLRLEEGALAATCDYCCTDSVVTRVSPQGRRRLDKEARIAERQLKAAISAVLTRRDDRRLARYITIPVLVITWLIFWFVMPSS